MSGWVAFILAGGGFLSCDCVASTPCEESIGKAFIFLARGQIAAFIISILLECIYVRRLQNMCCRGGALSRYAWLHSYKWFWHKGLEVTGPVLHNKIIRRTSQGHHRDNNDDTVHVIFNTTGHDEVVCTWEFSDSHHHDRGDDTETSDEKSLVYLARGRGSGLSFYTWMVLIIIIIIIIIAMMTLRHPTNNILWSQYILVLYKSFEHDFQHYCNKFMFWDGCG